MRRAACIVLCSLVLAAVAPAQRHGGGGRRGGGYYRGGWGHGVWTGGFRGYYGGFRGSYRRYAYYRPYRYSGWGYPTGIYAGFGFSYWPGYYRSPYYDPYVSYSYAAPVYLRIPYRERDPEPERPSQVVSLERYWLIAQRDSSIVAVADYWLEGSTLHYVTRQGTRASMELPELDIPFTRQLNTERGLDFRLPRAADTPAAAPSRRDSFGRPY